MYVMRAETSAFSRAAVSCASATRSDSSSTVKSTARWRAARSMVSARCCSALLRSRDSSSVASRRREAFSSFVAVACLAWG